MFTEALGYDPDNKQARDALARIASSNRRDAFIEAGDTAAANGDYDTALRQYENALQLGTDNPLSDKVTGIRVQILLKQARASLETGDIDKANELVIQASQLEPNNTDVAAVRNEVEVRGEYIRHLNAGDAARNRSAFGEAKRHYLRAKEAMDTPQVRSRLDEAEFDHLLAQARNYIAAGGIRQRPSAIKYRRRNTDHRRSARAARTGTGRGKRLHPLIRSLRTQPDHGF